MAACFAQHPGSLIARIAADTAASVKKQDAKRETFVFVVGDKQAGKTTLLNRFLLPAKAEAPKSSCDLDYTFARRPGPLEGSRQELAHIWELGGSCGEEGDAFATAVAGSSTLFLTPRQVTSAVVVIAVDLSDPGAAPRTAAAWLRRTAARLAQTYALFEARGMRLPEQLRQRQRGRGLWAAHEDAALVAHSGISLVLVGTKCDALAAAPGAACTPAAREAVARALRALAHAHGAHLLYTGGLQPGGGAGPEGCARRDGGAAQQAALLRGQWDELARLLTRLLFGGGGDRKQPPLRAPPQLDPQAGPLLAPAGSDRLAAVGRPGGQPWQGPAAPATGQHQRAGPADGEAAAGCSGSGDGGGSSEGAGGAMHPSVAALVDEWLGEVAATVPARPRPPPQPAGAAAREPRFAEEGVDAVRAQQLQQLAEFGG